MGIRQRFQSAFARRRPRQKTVSGLDSETLLKGYYGLIRSALRASVPGGWASDHYEETLHYTGWNYIAGHATAVQCAAAEVEVSRPTSNDEDAWTGKVWRKRFPRLDKRSGRERYFQAIATNGRSLSKSHDQGPTEDRDVMPEDFGLCRLLNRPNESQSGAHLRYEISVQLSQTGTALIVKVPNRLGKTVELYTVPTCLMTPRPASSQFPQGAYYVSPAATRTNWADDSFITMVGYQRLAGTTIDMRDLLKISIPHPLWKDEGYSPLAAGALWSDASEQIDRSRFSQFLNEARPSLIIKPPDGVNPTDNEIERVVQLLSSLYSGTSKTGRVMVAPGGCTVDQANVTPKDMDYGSGFTQLRDAIMGIHGVPLIAAGITDGGSYAAFYAALKQFIMLCVQPRLDWIAEELSYQLAPEYGDGLMIRLLATSIDDPSILESRLATDINARAIKKNEVRALRGLPDDPSGDVWVGEKETVSVNSDSAPGQTAEIAGTSDGGDEKTTGIATGQPSPASQHFAAAQESATPSIGEKRLRRLMKRLEKKLVERERHVNWYAENGINGKLPSSLSGRLDETDAMLKSISEQLAKRAEGDWHESDHPRGQPGNSGQFGPGGAGGGRSKPDTKKPSDKKPADGGPSLAELGKPDRERFKKERAEGRNMVEAARTVGDDGKAKIVLSDGSHAPEHIQKVISDIPPAAQGIQVALDPTSGKLASYFTVHKVTGKKISKTVYNPTTEGKNAELKFARTGDLLNHWHVVNEQVQADRKDPAKADMADCTWLLMEQATRPGSEKDAKGTEQLFGQPMTAKNVLVGEVDKKTGIPKVTLKLGDTEVPVRDEKARVELARRVKEKEPLFDSTYWLKSHGATTLEGRHVVQSKDGVRLQFIGKESVYHDHLIRDPKLAQMLLERKEKAGENGQLFNTNEVKLRKYVGDLDGGGFLSKDMRTARANLIALPLVRQAEAPTTHDEYRKLQREICEQVSHVLGNNWTKARDDYVDPAVWSQWVAGLPPEEPKKTKKGKKELQAA